MVSFILLSVSFSSVSMASTSMPSSERAQEVFMGLGPEVGTMLHAKLCTGFIGVTFLEVQSTYRIECCSLRNLFHQLFPQDSCLFIGETQEPLMLLKLPRR